MKLIWAMFFDCVKFNLLLTVIFQDLSIVMLSFIPLQVDRFIAACPGADTNPTPIPQSLWESFTTPSTWINPWLLQPVLHMCPFPPSEHHLCLFVFAYARCPLSYQTIKVYLHGIQQSSIWLSCLSY